jgi:hypothetical protein
MLLIWSISWDLENDMTTSGMENIALIKRIEISERQFKMNLLHKIIHYCSKLRKLKHWEIGTDNYIVLMEVLASEKTTSCSTWLYLSCNSRQYSSWQVQARFAHFRAFEHIEPLLGVVHCWCHISKLLMENDTGSHQIVLWLEGVRHSESLTGNIRRPGQGWNLIRFKVHIFSLNKTSKKGQPYHLSKFYNTGIKPTIRPWISENVVYSNS